MSRPNIKKIIRQSNLEKFDYVVNDKLLNEDVLVDIYKDFHDNKKIYQEELKNITNAFENLTKIAHSLRFRIKDPEHLIAKIIRNYDRNADKYSHISKDNYKNLVTDLIGIRIIILGKEDWKKVHDFLMSTFQNDEAYYFTKENEYKCDENPAYCLVEKPVIHTAGIGEDSKLYEGYEDIFDIKASDKGYRSIHYVGRFEKCIFEMQVRTIFDEGWLEFDHEIKYPNDEDNNIKGEYLLLMSKMAKTSQDMISFFRNNEKSFKTKKQPPKVPISISTGDKDRTITSTDLTQNFTERINLFLQTNK